MGIIAIIFGINEKTNSLSQESLTQMGTTLIVLIITVIAINLVIALILTVADVIKGIKEKVIQLRLQFSKNPKNKVYSKKLKDHFKTIIQRQFERNRFDRKPVKSKTLQPLSIPAVLPDDNSEDSRGELVARGGSLKAGQPCNSPLAKLITSPHDSIDLSVLRDQSPAKFIIPNKYKPHEIKRGDRISRLREWKQLSQDSKMSSDKEPSDLTELKEKIELPSENPC